VLSIPKAKRDELLCREGDGEEAGSDTGVREPKRENRLLLVVVGDGAGPGEEKDFCMGAGEVGAGVSIPMSFMVALILSRSRRSFSSSVVSSFLPPVTGLAPGFKVSGRRLGSGFFSPLLKRPFQSNDMDLRDDLVLGGLGGDPSFGTLKPGPVTLGESGADAVRPTITDCGRGLAVLGAAVEGVAGSFS